MTASAHTRMKAALLERRCEEARDKALGVDFGEAMFMDRMACDLRRALSGAFVPGDWPLEACIARAEGALKSD